MKPAYFFAWCFFKSTYAALFRLKCYHGERVPQNGAVILASNHASFLDPPLVGAGLARDIHYLGRENLFCNPLARWWLRGVNVVPVDRDGGGGKGLRIILDRLLNGAGIVLFPEGTRTPDGNLQPARAGIGLTVIKSTAPVVPVRLFGTYEAFGRHMKFPRLHPIAVKYGKPEMYESLRAEARSCSKTRLKEIYQEVADDLMRRIARLTPSWDVEHFP